MECDNFYILLEIKKLLENIEIIMAQIEKDLQKLKDKYE